MSISHFSFYISLLFSIWLGVLYVFLIPKKQWPKIKPIKKLQQQAKGVGWKVTTEECLLLLTLNLFLTLMAAVITHNAFILLGGFLIGFYLPRFLIERQRQKLRYHLISKLVDPLRLLLSRLPEQENITRAMEMTRDEIADLEIREIFNSFLRDITLGSSVRDALLNLKTQVNFRKFDLYVEHLLYAHYEGFTKEAIEALDKAVQAIEFDLRAIRKAEERSRDKKRKLHLILLLAWFFPLILSFVSTHEQNVYLHTLPGKIIIFAFVMGTVFVYIKGEEFLSLNFDDL